MNLSTSFGLSRRQLLRNAACGFGSLALQGLMSNVARATGQPLDRDVPNHPPRAKRAIFLFMPGGPSQPDLFDPKPYIVKHHGQAIAAPVDKHQLRVGVEQFLAMAPIAPVRPRGECGMMMSDLLPNLANIADDLCLLRAMHTDNKAHAPAQLQFHTGSLSEARPSIGSWISYGLGTENQNLPSFIAIDSLTDLRTYGSSFLPSIHQGTSLMLPDDKEVLAIKYLRDTSTEEAVQRRRLDFLQDMNQQLLSRVQDDAQMEGMIGSFELAFRMQTETPQLIDMADESDETLRSYGVNEKPTDHNGRACLLARRLSEAGVRFVQVNLGSWDHHGDIQRDLPISCAETDKPIAALICDLKQRGLLDETLILWSGEFGRSPWSQDISGTAPIEKHGREHQQESFCAFMAGGGVKPGLTYGATDDFGYLPVEGGIHLHDFHATIMHLLGLDHEKLTYRHEGRDFRLTDVYGNVVEDVLA